MAQHLLWQGRRRHGRACSSARSCGAGGLGAGTTRGSAGEARMEADPPGADLAVRQGDAPSPDVAGRQL